MKRLILAGACYALALGAGTVSAQDNSPSTVEERLKKVEDKQAILERQLEVKTESAAAGENVGLVVSNKDGFAIKSTDGNFSLKFSGYIQSDYRAYLNDQRSFTDTFLLRRIRPIFEGTVYRFVDFKIVPDFGGGTAVLQDAYTELRFMPWTKLRAGKFKVPVSLERLQSDASVPYVERGIQTNLTPNRDVGVQLGGDSPNETFSYQLGVFNGVVDNGSAVANSGDADTNDGKDYVARFFAQPFKSSHSDWINGFGAGVGASIGDQSGSRSSANLPAYKTNGQQTFFTYSADVFAKGSRRRWAPQAYWYIRNLGLLGEYAQTTQDVTRATTTITSASLTHRSWEISASYVLTGENASFKGTKPRHAFDPKNHTWGAFELVGRYGQLRIDDDTFPRYADPSRSAKRATTWSSGLNWYLNNFVRVSSDYEHTSFTGGASNGKDRRTEQAILSRVQLAF